MDQTGPDRNGPKKQIQTHLDKRRRKHRRSVVAVVVAVAAAAVVVAVVAAVAVVTAEKSVNNYVEWYSQSTKRFDFS